MNQQKDSADFPVTYIVINENAGGAQQNRELVETKVTEWQAGGREIKLQFLPPGEVNGCLENIPDEPRSLVIVGGGDGTLRHGAEVLRNSNHTLGILPLGTANLLARSLDIPLEIDEALDVALQGRERKIDAVEMNGRLFFNLCTIGLYPALAEKREARRQRHRRWPKLVRWWIDTCVSGAEVMRNWRYFHFRLIINGEVHDRDVITMALGNNDKLPLLEKNNLDGGEIVVYLPTSLSRWDFFVLMLKTVLRDPREIDLLEVERCQQVTIKVPPGTPISLDGEGVDDDGPLDFRSLPGQFRVRTP